MFTVRSILVLVISIGLSVSASAYQTKTADFSGNGTVDTYDLVLFLLNFGGTSGDDTYSYYYDLNNDGVVDLDDATILHEQIGKNTDYSICERTPEIVTALENLFADSTDCAEITPQHLATIKDTLDLSDKAIPLLSHGDFDGLVNVTVLSMDSTHTDSIAKGAFDGLTRVEKIFFRDHRLQGLADSMFVNLDNLKVLDFTSENSTAMLSIPIDVQRIDDYQASTVHPATIRVSLPIVAPRDFPVTVTIRNQHHGARRTVTIPKGKRDTTLIFETFDTEMSQWGYRGDHGTDLPYRLVTDMRYNGNGYFRYGRHSYEGTGYYGFTAIADTLCFYGENCDFTKTINAFHYWFDRNDDYQTYSQKVIYVDKEMSAADLGKTVTVIDKMCDLDYILPMYSAGEDSIQIVGPSVRTIYSATGSTINPSLGNKIGNMVNLDVPDEQDYEGSFYYNLKVEKILLDSYGNETREDKGTIILHRRCCH